MKTRRYFGAVFITFLITLVLAGSVAAQGGFLSYGESRTGTLSSQSPLVLYNFQGSEGDTITVQAISLSADFNPSVTLLGPTQQALAVSSSDMFAPFSPDARLWYRLPQNGTYSLLVGSEDGSQGDFLLRLFAQQSTTNGASPPDIPGEFSVAAASLPLNFSIPDTGVPVALSIISQTGDFSYMVEVRNSGGQTIALLTGLQEVSLTLPPGDTYNVTLYALNATAVGELRVVLNVIDLTPATTPEAPPPEPPTESCSLTPTGDNAINVRGGPGTNFSIVGVLGAGQTAAAIGRQGDWYAIDLNGVTGWVFSEVVTTSGDCENLAAPGDPASPTPTATGTLADDVTASPTPTPTATGTGEVDLQPTTTYTPTATPTATATQQVVQPTATSSPTATQAQQNLQPTATFTATPTATQQELQPTATFTPTSTITHTPTPSYTPTTPPPPPEAPPDANFNSPLNIPLDTTASVTDFVSFPGGDTEDRVRYDVTGMNPNASLSGGRARLIIAVSCFGTGTQNVEFFTGGQTFSCGQTIVDREITADSRTGTVTITAVSGQNTYVQWVLTGTATRVN